MAEENGNGSSLLVRQVIVAIVILLLSGFGGLTVYTNHTQAAQGERISSVEARTAMLDRWIATGGCKASDLETMHRALETLKQQVRELEAKGR